MDQLEEDKVELQAELESLNEQYQKVYMSEVSLNQEVTKLRQELEKTNMKCTAQGAIFKDVSSKYIKLKDSYQELSKRDEKFEVNGKNKEDLQEEINQVKEKIAEKIEQNTTL